MGYSCKNCNATLYDPDEDDLCSKCLRKAKKMFLDSVKKPCKECETVHFPYNLINGLCWKCRKPGDYND